MTVRFLEIAEIELDQAVQWYRAQAPGLCDAFLIEVLATADRIARFPELWHPLGEGVRRCRLSRFPYGLIYTFDSPGLQSPVDLGDVCSCPGAIFITPSPISTDDEFLRHDITV